MWAPDGGGGGAASPDAAALAADAPTRRRPSRMSDTQIARAADGLVVRNGGVTVSTDAMLAQIPQLRALAEQLDEDHHELALFQLRTIPALAPSLARCSATAQQAALDARALADAMALAQQEYADAEAAARSSSDLISQWIAAVAARSAVIGAAGALLAWPVTLAALKFGQWGWSMTEGTDAEKAAAVQRWIAENPQVYTNPQFVELVRRTVTGVDDAVLGAAGVPPFLLAILGKNGLGVLGVDTTARGLLAVRAAGDGTLLRETPVAVTLVGQRTDVAPPAGAAERFDRIPASADQIRIEMHSVPGKPDGYVVYVSPTVTFSPDATTEPWDLTSNVVGVAGLPSGSMRATELAMQQAGITADSPVAFVGYSQGGLVADQLTASGRWNVQALETYGDPGGGVTLPDGVAGYAVRHSDDFIPAIGGPQVDTDRITVERLAFSDPSRIPPDIPAPAHSREAYAETARMIDAASSPELRAEVDAINAFIADYTQREGSSMTVMTYRGERVSASASR